jgi:hypothetical protein
MALNTIDAKIKRLNNMGGYIAPRTAEILTHLVQQSQMQAAESTLTAIEYTELKEQVSRRFIEIEKAQLAEGEMSTLIHQKLAGDIEKLRKETATNTQLEKDLKELKNDNRIYFAVIVSMWLALIIGMGVVYYG